MSRGGDEYALEYDGYTAVITQIGAGVRALRHEGRDLVLPYRPDQVRPRYRGAVLAPWPNRIADGRYAFAGRPHQLGINEPARQTAIHGLVSWVRFDLESRTASTVSLRHRLVPQPGYPFLLDIGLRYSLDDDGLACEVTARNSGTSPAPYGTAPHPYLRGGEGTVDDWSLLLPADEVLEVTPDRLLPIHRVPVDGPFDFRVERRIGAVKLDNAFTRLRPDASGLVRARVMRDESTGVECVWDPGVLPWVQAHTADLPDAAESRRGLALEPMTCPPDAFNSGEDLVVLEPDAEHTASWTIRAA